MYEHIKSIRKMYLTVLLALLFVVKGKSDIKDVVGKAKGDIDDVIIRPTNVPDKCHNKVKNSAKDLYVTVSYELFLQNGQKVDSVEELHFKYGSKSVIQGITEGIYGMCEQEERFLNIPASKAYGVTGLENKVPPNENVIFNIKLLSLVEQTFTTAEEDFQDADINGDYRVSPEEFSAFHTRVVLIKCTTYVISF